MLGKTLIDIFIENQCEFFTGVPDSVLAGFCAECEKTRAPQTHVVAANEGNAVGLAIGWWLARRSVPVVYMQNSGLSNALNPLLSAAHVNVYATPMVLLVGWRGKPGCKDEPQHRVKGEITRQLAELCKFDVYVLEDDVTTKELIAEAVATARQKLSPTIVLVSPGFVTGAKSDTAVDISVWSRSAAISALLKLVKSDDALVATTGHIGRDVYGQLEASGKRVDNSFLCVGAMGHSSQIAAGVAMAQPDRQIWCFDGDGAFLMHLGGSSLIGQLKLKNLIHVVFNNGVHGSVGGTGTCAPKANLREVAKALGYERSLQISSEKELNAIDWGGAELTPTFIEIKISNEQGKNLGRPPEPLQALASAFQRFCVGDDANARAQGVS